MDDIENSIKELEKICKEKQKILLNNTYYQNILKTEEDTKLKIIYPIINKFNLSDNAIYTEVNTFGGGRADILLQYAELPYVVIEAKSANICLNYKHCVQLFNYQKTMRIPIGILTNGYTWEFYYFDSNLPEGQQYYKINTIRLDLGLKGDDLEFMSHFIDNNFNLTYFKSYE